jgi:DNA invertase Pin-like site-specific DNA recombinase
MGTRMNARLRIVKDAPPRAILYLRQSTYREESISLVLQETAARDYCDRMGYQVVGVKADPGVSGRTWKRRAVQEVMAEIENRTADVIVLWRWSRLSRNRKDWAIAADRVDVAGGSIESATEPNDVATAAGRFARGVMVELAAFESERIGENWKEVHSNRISRGLPTGRLPWGWRHTEDGIEPHPDQAAAIPRLYEMYLAGAGGRELARWLEAHGYLTFYGKRSWNNSTITAILDSPIHSGQVVHHGELFPGAHEALVTAETWNRYRAMRRIRADERAARHTYLLSGILTCGTCEQPMFGIANHHGKRAKTSYFAYRCRTVSAQSDHGPASVATTLIDDAFLDWLRKFGADSEEPEVDTSPDERLEAERIAREIAAIDEQIVQLTIQLGMPGAAAIPRRAYDAAVAHHEARRATLEATLSAIEDSLTVAPADPREAATRLLDVWDIIPVEGRRASIRELVERIVVRHGESRSMEIHPRGRRPVSIAL